MDADNKPNKSNRFTIPYHAFVKITGHLKAGLLLHTLCFWWFVMSGKRGNDDVEFYKSRQELTNETSLTTQEQRTALSLLQKMDLVSFRSIGFKRSLWYRINHNKINDLLKSDGKNSLKIDHLLPEQQIDLLPEQQLHCNNIIYSFVQSDSSSFKESVAIATPNSENSTAQNPNSYAESQSAHAKPTGIQTMSLTPCSLDDLISALTSPTTADEPPKKKRKVVRQRKPQEHRMIEAKRAPEEFYAEEKDYYETCWVQHMARRGCSAAQLEENKTIWLKFKQDNYNVVLIMKHYVSEGVYGISEARIRADIAKGIHAKVVKVLSNAERAARREAARRRLEAEEAAERQPSRIAYPTSKYARG